MYPVPDGSVVRVWKLRYKIHFILFDRWRIIAPAVEILNLSLG